MPRKSHEGTAENRTERTWKTQEASDKNSWEMHAKSHDARVENRILHGQAIRAKMTIASRIHWKPLTGIQMKMAPENAIKRKIRRKNRREKETQKRNTLKEDEEKR